MASTMAARCNSMISACVIFLVTNSRAGDVLRSMVDVGRIEGDDVDAGGFAGQIAAVGLSDIRGNRRNIRAEQLEAPAMHLAPKYAGAIGDIGSHVAVADKVGRRWR